MDMMAQMTWDPTFFFLALLAVTVAVLLLRVQRYYGRSGGASTYTPPAKPEPASRARPAEGPVAMAAWEVQMHETARALKGQLDSKIGVLEQLIREADRAASRLEAALAAARPSTQAEGLKAAGTADRPVAPPGEESPGHRPPMERRYEEIYTLADYGYEAAEIAQRVGAPVGEVQLILGLRAKR
jgi:hypothetical protein